MLHPNDRSVKLGKLSSNTRYLICIRGLGNWLTRFNDTNDLSKFNFLRGDIFDARSLPKMVDSATSRCTEVRTLEVPDAIVSSGGALLNDVSVVSSILTRRLGLIVGCCMGFVVFVLLISILGYLKVKKQREAVKRDAQPIPPEYISYRHFSIQSGEAGEAAAKVAAREEHQTTLDVWKKMFLHACVSYSIWVTPYRHKYKKKRIARYLRG